MFDKFEIDTEKAAEVIALQQALSNARGKALHLRVYEAHPEKNRKHVLVWSGLIYQAESTFDFADRESVYLSLLGSNTVRVEISLEDLMKKIEGTTEN